MKNSARIPLIIVVVIAVLLLVLHVALPTIIRNLLNDKMAQMGDYSGHVDDIDVSWWRGAYSLNGLTIEKTEDNTRVPFLKVPELDIGLDWRTLFSERALVAELRFEQPELNFVDSKDDEDEQTGKGVGWREQLKGLMPITLDRVHINDGAVHFRNFTSDPPVNVYANKINMTVRNLSNTADSVGPRTASLEGTAQFLNHAPLEVSATFDPLLEMENFDLQLRLTEVDLTRLNDFARAYGNFDFHSGTGDLVVEVDATDSQLDGYIKPLLRNAEVFDWQQDVEQQEKGFWRNVWEGVVGVTEDLLKNQPENQSATRVELSGNLKQTDISPVQAFVAILRNAFIDAFRPQFEGATGGGED